MLKYIYIGLCLVTGFISQSSSQDLQTAQVKPQDEWKANWLGVIAKIDSMFTREQAQFRLMQTYQNEATEELIIKDMDSLNVFMNDVNAHIDIANSFEFPSNADGKNAAETMRLKVGVLAEYFEQNMLQIEVNNRILQKKLKNESLDFKVSQVRELKLKDFTPTYKQ
jgi:hypothetical protein